MAYFQGPKYGKKSAGFQPPDGLSYFLGGQAPGASPMNPAEPDPYATPPTASAQGVQKGTGSQATSDPQQAAQVAAAQVMAQSPQGAATQGADSGGQPSGPTTFDPNTEVMWAHALASGMLGRDATPQEASQAREYVQAFRAAAGRMWTSAEFEQVKTWLRQQYTANGRVPTPEEFYSVAQGYAGAGNPGDGGGGTPPGGGFGGGSPVGGGASGVVAVNMEKGEDGQLRFTGNFSPFGETGGGKMTGMNLFHEILAQTPNLDLGRIVVEQGVGGIAGNFRVTAPPEYQQAIAEALQQTTQALQSTLDVGYGKDQAGMGLVSGLEQALSDPALAERYKSAFEGAGLTVPTEAQVRGLVNAARAAQGGAPVPAGMPGDDVFAQYYNAAQNAGIDTPYAAQGGRGILRGPGGAAINPNYFGSVRRYRGGGGRALSQALGGY